MLDILRRAVGAEGVLDARAAHQYAVRGRVPAAVVAPRDREGAAAVMRLATQEGWSVMCAGAGTRLGHGNVGAPPDVVLTTLRMNVIADYEPADLVLTAQAGVPLSQIGAITRQHKQFLALDPAVLAAATIGGVVASAAAGPLRIAHGTPRDHVLGLEMVAADARVLHFGGKVVKNVAGYDVVRPLVGSRGTLGLITEVSIRLKPLPETDLTVVISTNEFNEAAAVSEAILAEHLDVVALEIISPPLAAEIDAAGWTLLARLHGNADSVRDAVERIRPLAGNASLQIAEHETHWHTLGAVEAGAEVNVRFANLPSLLRETTAAAMRLAERGALTTPRIAIHAGDGIVRLLASDMSIESGSIVKDERAAIESRGGTLIVECARRTVGLDAFGPVDGQALMAGVKRVFDPANILASGAIAG